MAKKKSVTQESLKRFIRKESANYLKNPNITSVGIGYKVQQGKTTGELSVQFTVGQKAAPEALEELGSELIPKFVTVDGIDVPTDVIERSYGTEFRIISESEARRKKSARKVVCDPIVPGVSIGHPSISAGTVGCVVYDANSGTPYVLSNWHVLCGAEGQIGDEVVQPGRYDDDRVENNVAGRLVRSHLGIAGDCAIAEIDNRRLEREIMGLGVAIERLGEAVLGDHVVKSGRTTEITYGIVTRTNVVVKVHYAGPGIVQIGCIEIGPDPKRPAVEGEISMGGDSGGVWVAMEKNKPSKVMLGLHFAGEVGDAPEHALACYPKSVFEKLEISPNVNIGATEEQKRLGFQVDFLGLPVATPTPSNTRVEKDLLIVGRKSVLDYTHFSLAMSKSRRFALWVAWNIDGGSIRKVSRKGIAFRKDPSLPSAAQVGNELYSNNQLDRGHIARRADLLWGSAAEAKQANEDSFYYSNITPQHQAFNQSGAGGIWGELENAIFAEVEVEDLRISVMGGPIFSETDPTYRNVKLPKQFWKVLYFRETGAENLSVKGYVLTQKDLLNELEVLDLPEFQVFEVDVSKISEMIGFELTTTQQSRTTKSRHSKRGAETEAAIKSVRKVASVADIVK